MCASLSVQYRFNLPRVAGSLCGRLHIKRRMQEGNGSQGLTNLRVASCPWWMVWRCCAARRAPGGPQPTPVAARGAESVRQKGSQNP